MRRNYSQAVCRARSPIVELPPGLLQGGRSFPLWWETYLGNVVAHEYTMQDNVVVPLKILEGEPLHLRKTNYRLKALHGAVISEEHKNENSKLTCRDTSALEEL